MSRVVQVALRPSVPHPESDRGSSVLVHVSISCAFDWATNAMLGSLKLERARGPGGRDGERSKHARSSQSDGK